MILADDVHMGKLQAADRGMPNLPFPGYLLLRGTEHPNKKCSMLPHLPVTAILLPTYLEHE